MSEEVQSGNWVGDGIQVGVDVEGGVEFSPDVPCIFGGIMMGVADTQGEVFCDNAEFSSETSLVGRRASCQEVGQLKCLFMWSRSSWSKRAKEREQKSAMTLEVPRTDTGHKLKAPSWLV